MSLGPSSSAIHIQNPTPVSSHGPQTPTSITIHPTALFSILDHYLRRTSSQTRVIGTLLGRRTDSDHQVHVHSSFAMLHTETNELVALDEDYLRGMLELCLKVNSKDVIVGWYSTGSNFNTNTALIQNFYSQEIAPYHAVHVALNTGLEKGEKAGVNAYVSSPVGVTPKPENCIFIPIPVELKFQDSERSAIVLITQSLHSPTSPPRTDLEVLETTLLSISAMLDRVLTYVRSVLSGSVEGNKAVGRYLMDAIGGGATGAGTDEMEKGGFNASLQDTLMVTYLANLVRSQAEVSARLALATAA